MSVTPTGQSLPSSRRRCAKSVGIAVGVLGLVLAVALEADVGLESGLWYPIIYAGAPTIVAVAVFVHERPSVGIPAMIGVGSWILVSSVLALAAVVVISLGFTPRRPRVPIAAVVSAALLYAGFLLLPVALTTLAARQRGLRAVIPLAISPFGQGTAAALLILVA